MKETVQKRMEQLSKDVQELKSEKVRLEQIQANVVDGLGQIEKAFAQKAGALTELKALMGMMEAKEKEEVNPPKVVEAKAPKLVPKEGEKEKK